MPSGIYVRTEEHKKKISLGLLGHATTWKGKTHTKKTIEKIRLGIKKHLPQTTFKKGCIPHNKNKEHISNEKHWEWKGEAVGYRALHHWVSRHLPRIKECVYCGEDEKRIEWASISHNAKRDLNDYIPLCKSCHGRYDAEFRKKGGDYFEFK